MTIFRMMLAVSAAWFASISVVDAFSSPRAALKLGDMRIEESAQTNSSAQGSMVVLEDMPKAPQQFATGSAGFPFEVFRQKISFGNMSWLSQLSSVAPEKAIHGVVDMASVGFVSLLEVNGPFTPVKTFSSEELSYQVPFKFWLAVIGNIVTISFTCVLISSRSKPVSTSTKNKGITAEAMRREVPLDELATHNIQSDVWMAIDGIVCDITDFVHVHPGGADLLQELAGKDATDQFRDVGHSEFALDLIKERAVGVLTESKYDPTKPDDTDKQSNGSLGDMKLFLKKRLPSTVLALFTHEDPYNLHKIMGVVVLVHYVVRFAFILQGAALWQEVEGHRRHGKVDWMLFDGSWFSLLSVWFCLLLQISSFQFVLPRNRVLGRPMLWQEWRAHNLIFVLRSLISFTTCWAAARWHMHSMRGECLLQIIRFGAVLFQLYSTDVTSRLLRDSKHESLTATWPLWEGCPSGVERFLKFYYAIGINQLTLIALSGAGMYYNFAGVLLLQTDSFAMTLVRKGIIKTETFHGYYFWNMVHVAFMTIHTSHKINSWSEFTASNWMYHFSQIYAIPIAIYVCRYRGLSKYGCWTAVFVSLMATNVFGLSSEIGLLLIPGVWLLWAIVQFSFAGFVFEHRIRRFLEGGRSKPLRLKSRECLAGSMYRLRFEVPAGFSCGLMPGQHVKLHTPNISKGIKTWNGRDNLEVDSLEICRSYTPISPADSSFVEVLMKYYPNAESDKFPEGGRASTYLIKDLKVGEDVMVSGPHGHRIYFGNGEFEVQVGRPKVKPRVCAVLAGGSGITPALSVIREVQAEARRKTDSTEAMRKQDYENDVAIECFQVIHANQKDADVLPLAFYEDSKQGGQLVPIHVCNLVTGPQCEKHKRLESAPEDSVDAREKRCLPTWSIRQGKITKEVIADSFEAPKDDVLVLVCGPHGFVVDFAQPLLREMGYKHVIGMW
eukprot:TRINITY_DN62914_c0_g1_i1.p1 TRINITY_DN62914_c0_g1~~TRINITY_DN62914_c0_g1_i1.p1  ORF type:complete len:950 (-),score=138.75 TRINITY_DN62914_c0_g1_i1:16-2865(-)